MPKVRFISCATGAISGAPALPGWAGWDHQQQAYAIAAYLINQDLSSEEMTPFLAGLLKLQPWLDQWHKELDASGFSPAEFIRNQRMSEQGTRGLTDDDLRAWRPAPTARRGRRATKG